METSNWLWLTQGTGCAQVFLPFPGQRFAQTRVPPLPHAPHSPVAGFYTVCAVPHHSLISLTRDAHGRGLQDEGALPPRDLGVAGPVQGESSSV